MIYRYEIADLGVEAPAFDPLALGVEITVPDIAAACGLGNVDPQHAQGAQSIAPAAIEKCLDLPLPPPGAKLITVLPDLDALGAMALLTLRAEGAPLNDALVERVRRVAAADRFDFGSWPGRRPLPRRVADLLPYWPMHDIGVVNSAIRGQLANGTSRRDSKALCDVVAMLKTWLLDGSLPNSADVALRRTLQSLLEGISEGTIAIDARCDGRIGVVKSDKPMALRLGYSLAPVVVALQPAFRFDSGETGPRYTIARWACGDADLNIAMQAIAHDEDEWGGQEGIKGSPQRRPSRLSLDTVIDAVEMALSKK